MKLINYFIGICIYVLLAAFSCNQDASTMLLGKWYNYEDRYSVIEIRPNTISYYTKGKLEVVNEIRIVKSANINEFFSKKDNAYDFSKNKKERFNELKIIEIDKRFNDTIENKVVYLGLNDLEMISLASHVVFKRKR